MIFLFSKFRSATPNRTSTRDALRWPSQNRLDLDLRDPHRGFDGWVPSFLDADLLSNSLGPWYRNDAARIRKIVIQETSKGYLPGTATFRNAPTGRTGKKAPCSLL